MKIIEEGCLCFDIGANIGQSADQFLKAGAKHVVSVEPCIENYLLLARRANVTPILAAAWDSFTILNARLAFNEIGWSSVQPEKWNIAYPKAQWAAPQPVVTITLDLLRKIYGEPHFIKIDVEGSEVQVLRGLSQPSPFLAFEFHGKFMADAHECLTICKTLGYRRAHYVREGVDIDTIPTTPIDEFRDRWAADAPEWGNITVF